MAEGISLEKYVAAKVSSTPDIGEVENPADPTLPGGKS